MHEADFQYGRIGPVNYVQPKKHDNSRTYVMLPRIMKPLCKTRNIPFGE